MREEVAEAACWIAAGLREKVEFQTCTNAAGTPKRIWESWEAPERIGASAPVAPSITKLTDE